MIDSRITLQDIIDKCKCSVTVAVNYHKDDHKSVQSYLDDISSIYECSEIKELPDNVLAEMIARDTVIHIQTYPKTPIRFYHVFHYDLQQAIANMYGLLQGE